MERPRLADKSVADVLLELQSDRDKGLSKDSIKKNKNQPQGLMSRDRTNDLRLLLSQFKSPFMILLLVADTLSFFLGEPVDAVIILSVIVLSGILSFFQEKGARDIINKLLDLVRVKVAVLRDGTKQEIVVDEVTEGDIVLLAAGDVIPADCMVIESKDLYVNEAMLTGEAFPVYKSANREEEPGNAEIHLLFKGTHVSSGYARAVAIATGEATQFGKIQHRLGLAKEETEFERGLKKFSYLLMQVALVLTFIIFAINIYFGKPFVDSLLFSLSLSIGITPFLLPAIVSVNLAFGARHMAAKKVIVKRLVSIENFGSMNVFCSDKTGTLTSGQMKISSYLDAEGKQNGQVLEYAYLNASLQTGYQNPVDDAIRNSPPDGVKEHKKLDEMPYDFVRKCLSVLVEYDGEVLLVTKGAFRNILDKCKYVEVQGKREEITSYAEDIENQYEHYSAEGFRIIAVAFCKDLKAEAGIVEENLTFAGMLLFHDPLKEGVKEAVDRLHAMGIGLKVLTGDNRKVTSYVGKLLGLDPSTLLTGSDINAMTDEALKLKANTVALFAELEPMQKERIIRQLSNSGNVVGYIGDGINDVSALHSADVGISVSNGVDVARSAADLILLEKDLNVLADGVAEGRRTFINTIKYIFMTSSANFGNIISMSVMSLFLPFLPLLPKQLLASNFITDIPAMAIPSDTVDEAWIKTPKKWDVSFIKKFMICFGLLSSLFDFLTFGLLIVLLKSSPEEFRTGWFMVTIWTEFVVLWILRSRHIFYKSRPGKLLFYSTFAMFALTFMLPYVRLGEVLGLIPLPADHLAGMLGIVVLYAGANEIMKRIFYRRVHL